MQINSQVFFGQGSNSQVSSQASRDGWYTRAQKDLAKSYSSVACDVFQSVSGKQVDSDTRAKCADKLYKAGDALDWITIGADLMK